MTTPRAGQPRRQDLELLDYIRELTEDHRHRQHYQIRRGRTWYGDNHVTEVPSLIDQLVHGSPSGAVNERDNSGYESRPAARIDALDTLMEIDRQAARWVRTLGHDDPGDKIDRTTGSTLAGTGTAQCIRLLGGLAPSLPKPIRSQLTADVRRWWTWARIISGWDSPAWRPDNTCPMCGERRTLRVNLEAEVAFCTAETCHETWDNTNIGLLADHIRHESEQEGRRARVVTAIPCACRWPMRHQDHGRWGLCPICGSAFCVNAEAVAEREEQRRLAAREQARLEQLERIAAHATRARMTRPVQRGA